MIRIHTLGASHIDVGRNRIEPASFRSFALLLHLSAERKRPVLRTALQELIFPDKTERRARHSLREVVYTLRRSGVTIKSDGDALAITDRVRCDYAELIARARPDDVQVKAAEGGFLPGYSPTHSEAFAEWFDGYRARAIFGLTKALLKEVHRARSVADWGATERAARACLALDALNEEATLALAEVLALGGSKAKAVKLLDDYMAEVGTSGADLRVSAGVLKRRIAERVSDSYRPASTLTFVGREEEMLRATECFQRARAGERQCLVIGGEPGIGKSRLASELQNSILLTGAETRRVTMQPHDARRPLSVFMELVPQLLQMRGAIGCSPESLQLLKRLTERQEEPAPTEMRPEALAFLSTALEHAIRELVEAVASETYLSLFIDDAHWLDDASLQTLVGLLSDRRTARILVVLTAREHRSIAERFSDAENLRILPLRRLSDASLRTLLDEWYDGTKKLRPTAGTGRIVATASGNPLFALLLARDSTELSSEGHVPRSILEVLCRRLGVLDDRKRALLVTCIAFGRHCTFGRLIVALNMPRIDLLATLSALSDAGLLTTEGDSLLSGHPLIAEALHETIDAAVTRGAHHCAAEVLEREADEQNSLALYWQCSDCWLVAEEHDRAIAALRRCAKHAQALGRMQEAIATLEKATGLRGSPRSLSDATRDLVVAADLASEPGLSQSACRQLRGLGAPEAHDDVEIASTRAEFLLADAPPDLCDRLLRCARATDASPGHRTWAATMLLKCGHIVGNQTLIVTAKDTFDRENPSDVPALLRLEFDLVYAAANYDDEAVHVAARRMSSYSEQLSKPVWLSVQFNIGLALWFAGASIEAVQVLSAAYRVACEFGLGALQLRLAATLASFSIDLRDEAVADEWLSRAEALATKYATTRPMFTYLTTAVDIATARGQSERSIELISQMEELGLMTGSPMRRSWRIPIELRRRLLLESLEPDDEQLARSLFTELQPMPSGINDYEVATACEILAAFGQTSEARERMLGYLQSTRVGSQPLSYSLQIAADKLSLDVHTTWPNTRREIAAE